MNDPSLFEFNKHTFSIAQCNKSNKYMSIYNIFVCSILSEPNEICCLSSIDKNYKKWRGRRRDKGKEYWDLVGFSIKTNVRKCFLFLISSSLSSLLSPALYGARLISHLCCQFYFGDRDQGPHMAWQGPSGLLQQPPGRVSVTVLVKRCWWWWWSEMSSGSDDLQSDPHRQLFRQLLDGDFICSWYAMQTDFNLWG